MNNQSHSSDKDTLAQLLQLAGEPDPVPTDVAARVRSTVHASWQDQVSLTRRRTQWRFLAVAATAVLAAGLLWMLPNRPGGGAQALAQVVRVASGVAHIAEGQTGTALLQGATLKRGDRVVTSTAPAALVWTSGHAVRLDRDTELIADSAAQLTLLRGRIYVDSKAAEVGAVGSSGQSPGEALVVQTLLGPVRDIGTQYLVRLDAEMLSVKVREGVVQIDDANLAIEQGYGVDLQLVDAGAAKSEPMPIETTGADWQWAAEAAPEFNAEGKSLHEFLRWLARENGWQLKYANLRVRRAAQQESLSSRPRGASAREKLNNALESFNYQYRIEKGVLLVTD